MEKGKQQLVLGFLVLIMVTVKSIIFLDVTLCIPIEGHQSFGETYCLHFQAQRVSQATILQEEDGKQSFLPPDLHWLQSWFTLLPRRWR
jgi:hypothetical protein